MEVKNKECIICYENENNIIQFCHKKCILYICKECIVKIKKYNICPYCRKNIVNNENYEKIIEILKLLLLILIFLIILLNYLIFIVIIYYLFTLL